MKLVLPLLAFVLFASSCSTAYKSGQTPDDVYYSPAKVVTGNDYVQMDRNDNRRYRQQQQRRDMYDDPYAYNDDRYLRMKVRNRRMWSELDYYYYNDPYAFGNYNRFWGNTYWSPFGYWNAYSNWNFMYNPYYRPFGQVIVVNPSSPVYNRPRTVNLNSYGSTNGTPVYNNKRSNNQYYTPGNNNSYNNSRTRSFGNDIRESFGNSRSNNNNSVSQPSRSSSSSGSSSSGSSNSGGNAPVRRF